MSSIGPAVARVHIGQAPAEGEPAPIEVLSRAPVAPRRRKVARVGVPAAAALLWASATAALCSVKWGGRRSGRVMWTLAGSATGVAVASMTAALLARVGR